MTAPFVTLYKVTCSDLYNLPNFHRVGKKSVDKAEKSWYNVIELKKENIVMKRIMLIRN